MRLQLARRLIAGEDHWNEDAFLFCPRRSQNLKQLLLDRSGNIQYSGPKEIRGTRHVFKQQPSCTSLTLFVGSALTVVDASHNASNLTTDVNESHPPEITAAGSVTCQPGGALTNHWTRAIPPKPGIENQRSMGEKPRSSNWAIPHDLLRTHILYIFYI